MAKKLPKTLFVKIETDSDTDYFIGDTDPASLVDKGEKVTIGRYQLAETFVGESMVKLSSQKPAK